MYSVEKVEEILARRPFAGRILVWKVLGEFGVFVKLRPEPFHRKLIVVRDCDLHNKILLHELLLAR